MNLHLLEEAIRDETDEDSTWARRLRAAVRQLNGVQEYYEDPKFEQIVDNVAHVLGEVWPDLSARDLLEQMYRRENGRWRMIGGISHRSGYRDPQRGFPQKGRKI